MATATYLVLNGDGFPVGEYESLVHANEAAEDMARRAAQENDLTNFYSVTDEYGNEIEGGKEYAALDYV